MRQLRHAVVPLAAPSVACSAETRQALNDMGGLLRDLRAHDDADANSAPYESSVAELP